MPTFSGAENLRINPADSVNPGLVLGCANYAKFCAIKRNTKVIFSGKFREIRIEKFSTKNHFRTIFTLLHEHLAKVCNRLSRNLAGKTF
jgi:hypothetical protein